MNRGADFKKAIPHSCVDFWIAVLGAGASAPTLPANGALTPATSTYPVRANGVSQVTTEAPTRTSAGLYVITFAHLVPTALFASGSVVAAGASPTGNLRATVTKLDAPNRQITVQVNDATAGTATDIGTSDMLVLKVEVQISTV